ncbi:MULTISPECIES: hypothetical protein [unclassified Streptomyces]|uniref:hypothetical protein n=1 Tax=unclassified Streptomyces TaxID=2593676 RepID=UPI0035D5D51E
MSGTNEFWKWTRVSENEQTGHEHDDVELPTGTGGNTGRPGEWEHPPASRQPAAPEQREGRVARQEQPVPPGDRLAHLGHIEHPVEMWTDMKFMPGKTTADPDDVNRWKETIFRATDPGTLAMAAVEHEALRITLDSSPEVGGSGEARARFLLDTDPQGTVATPTGDPGLGLCRTCLTPVDQPSPECTSPFNHKEAN